MQRKQSIRPSELKGNNSKIDRRLLEFDTKVPGDGSSDFRQEARHRNTTDSILEQTSRGKTNS